MKVHEAQPSERVSASKCILHTALIAALVGCGPAKTPSAGLAALATRYVDTLQREAEGDDAKALAQTLALAKDAAKVEDFAGADVALAVDQLLRETILPGYARYAGLAYRTGALHDTAKALEDAAKKGSSAAARPLLAASAADFYADADRLEDAKRARTLSGCVQTATISAPDTYRSDAVRDGAESSAPAKAWPGSVTSVFGAKVTDVISAGHGCELRTIAASAATGTRSVAVDVITHGAEAVVVHARGSALGIHLGGKRLLSVRSGALRENQHHVAGANVRGDVVRLVVRIVADDEARSLSLHVVDGEGNPLETRPVRAGSRADGEALQPLARSQWKPSGAERALAAHGLIARGLIDEANAMARSCADAGSEPAACAHAELLTLANALDLPDSDRLDRQRQAYERMQKQWPRAWQAAVGIADNVGQRRGEGERAITTFAALRDPKEGAREPWTAKDAPLGLRVAAWSIARRARLYDIARTLEPTGATTPWLREARLEGREVTPTELASEACGALRPAATDGRCHTALAAIGKTREALSELERITALRGAPSSDAHARLRLALALDDLDKVRAIANAMSPGERTLAVLYLTEQKRPLTERALFDAAVHSADAIVSLPALSARTRSGESDFVSSFDEAARAAVDKDRKSPAQQGAPTLILHRVEHYRVEQSGLLHYWLGDVRRLSGTADVEENAEPNRPGIYGQATSTVRLRRILKKDGRSLLPDPTPMASQAHAELSQLEAGDYVLSVYEGFGLPGPTWTLGMDSPDLLPNRTAVVNAELRAEWPDTAGLQVALHPLWGTATKGSKDGVQQLTARVQNAPVRKRGENVPRSQRTVHLSLSTLRWDDLIRAMSDEASRLTEPDAEVSAFARNSVQNAQTVHDKVEALLRAVGERITRGAGSAFADYSVSSAYGMTNETARSTLTSREGSRTMVLSAALRSLGIAHEIVVAEEEPWSNGESYPPHPGRFLHPLLRVLPTKSAGSATKGSTADLREEIWIDADVPGRPLPLGQVSAELTGRYAVNLSSGRIEPLPAGAFRVEQDEIDIRLNLDERGNAVGETTLLLRGKLAGELSAAFERVVGQERDRILRSLVSAWIPGATVDEAALSEREGIAVRARLSAGAYAETQNNVIGRPAPVSANATLIIPGHVALHFDGAERATLLERYGNALTREGTLTIRDAVRYHVRRSITLPAGFSLERGPGPLQVSAPGLRATRSFQIDKNTLVDEVELSLQTQTVDAEALPGFIDTLRQIDEGLLAAVRIKR